VVDNFYRAFEDRYRGSRELIKSRLQVYVPFIRPFLTKSASPVALDLGCGRGEWLELLTEEGFQAAGVDLDDGMLEACRDLGLNAQKGDVLDALHAAPDASLSIVSAFHVVEHIDFGILTELVKESLRVLAPGGILILETPNPENLLVASCNFYLDPSHKQPIPPTLLGFVAEFSGFARVKKLGLQESAALRDLASDVRLQDVLEGVSPDYAIVAQKLGDEEVSRLFDDAFSAEYGLGLHTLTDRFEARSVRREEALSAQIQNSTEQVLALKEQTQQSTEQTLQLQERVQQSNEKILRLQEHIQQSNEQILQLKEQIQQSSQQILQFQEQAQQSNQQVAQLMDQVQQSHALIHQMQAEVHQSVGQLQAVYASNCWRITAPLRKLSALASSGSTAAKSSLKPVLRRVAVHVKRRPRLKRFAVSVLNRVPALKTRLARVVLAEEAVTTPLILSVEDDHGRLLVHPCVLPDSPTVPETMLLPEVVSNSLRWVRLTGHVEGHYSLAIVNRGLAGALERMTKGKLSFIPYHGVPYSEVPTLPTEQEALLHAPLRRSIPSEAVGDAISVVHHYPFINDDQPAGQRGIVFFWEETSVPDDIIDHLNAHFDVVWVAAESVKRALLNSGCRAPVFVIPIGVDHLISSDEQPLGHLRVAEGQRFRFLHVSSVFERKGADVLLAAYLDAFTADDAVELYIKTFPNPHNQIHAQLKAISVGHDKPARVVIDEEPLDDAGMLALYRSAHAMVLPTRGEGFNLPAAEALAMALPVVTTGSGAQVDFCSRATSTLTNFRYAPSRSHVRSSEACWLEPDSADLAAKLRVIHKRVLAQDPMLDAQRQAGLQHVRNTYRWENGARGLLASADWLANQSNVEHDPLRMALVSPWATRCGIAEYSHKLLTAVIDNPGVQLHIYCDDRTDAPPINASVSWSLGNNNTVPDVFERIVHTDAEVVLVQHQPSLFPLSDICCQRLVTLHDEGRIVILELHSTLPLLEECRVSAEAVGMLARLDRIIVHKPEDLNNLLALGLADNVMLMHHGVVQPLANPEPIVTRAELGIPEDAVVLGCFGFALPHKGIDTLVEVVKPLAQAIRRTVHLVALNSVLDQRSEQMIRQCQERARQLGVDGNIHWITDYRPIEVCQKLLGAADYILFPYKNTRESASGAVTIGLSTLKPVLVSPLEIFSDLSDITWKMEGYGVDEIVRAVQTLHEQPQATVDLVERQRNWLRARDWKRLSGRLLTLMTALRRERRLADAIAPMRRDWEAVWEGGQRKQLLVDVSELYYRDARTGIQRVVRNILAELFRNPPDSYEICPVYGDKAEGFRYTSKFNQDGISWNDELPVEIGKGDIFLGLDLAAHLFPEAEQHMSNFRRAGARIFYVIYDIIPLRNPQFTVSGITQAFQVWLRSLANCVDGLVCISQAVAHDVENWLTVLLPGAPLPKVSYFHLGADIDYATPTQSLPDGPDPVLEAMKKAVSFLMVGTLEPRKGHEQVLDAFEKLWEEKGFTNNLIIVGKQGWMVDEFAKRLRNHPEFNRRLFWLEGVGDAYLEKLYAASACLIAASYDEGFGLPLIEAAQHKLPIIARDIPVFREVAGNYAFYFQGNSTQGLVETIDEWLELYEGDNHPSSDGMPWLTWRQSTKMLLAEIMSEDQLLENSNKH
jgi:glycosyltransferase involved in cell wall biosynthesis/SAM-dependent methyltransferase/uncharacterized protein YoxC